MKICQNCGETLLPTNQEKYDAYRDTYYCERYEERYIEEVISEEGAGVK